MSTVRSELSNTRRRTQAALVAAARDLLARGVAPTIEEAAQAAEVSRTTAYRYFPNQTALLVAAHPEVATDSLLGPEPPADATARLDEVMERFVALILESEPQQRATLRLSLGGAGEPQEALPLRQGRAIPWILEALEPLRDRFSEPELHRLALAIRSATGIEALVWLRDVGGLAPDEAAEVMRWSARAMLLAAIDSGPPGTDKVVR
jgi:AcrR family transcriptional regulator